ncbi:MAG: hypothetical protein Pars2KO_00730 [Parasphingorhabdus sp.]
MKNAEDLSDVVESLEQALRCLDELDLKIVAVKVAEALEMLSSHKSDAD